jgi:hypothetical protein
MVVRDKAFQVFFDLLPIGKRAIRTFKVKKISILKCWIRDGQMILTT